MAGRSSGSPRTIISSRCSGPCCSSSRWWSSRHPGEGRDLRTRSLGGLHETPAFAGVTDQAAAAASACFLAISRLRRRTLRLNLSSLVFKSQLSRPPTCSTERNPLIDTRGRRRRGGGWEIGVACCGLGRNARLVLLLAWETLLPPSRPLPVSSQ